MGGPHFMLPSLPKATSFGPLVIFGTSSTHFTPKRRPRDDSVVKTKTLKSGSQKAKLSKVSFDNKDLKVKF